MLSDGAGNVGAPLDLENPIVAEIICGKIAVNQ
jgi:hypothetical protein